MTTITTYVTRTEVDLENPTVEMIHLRDIAHALAQTNRFTGHTGLPYTVADHCNLGFPLIKREFALEWMLHDASEAYLGDVSGPLKSIIGPIYRDLEGKFEAVIAKKFGLTTEAYPLVKEVDLRLLAAEQKFRWCSEESIVDRDVPGEFLLMMGFFDREKYGKERFLEICHELIEERYLGYVAAVRNYTRAGT